MSSEPLQEIFDYIDKNQDNYVGRLRDWVRVQSISNEKDKRGEIRTMLETCLTDLTSLGAKCRILENPEAAAHPEENYPPILLGKLGEDDSKKTLLVYGHLDVMPVKADEWKIDDPFEMTELEEDGKKKLYGRGTTDDKGPVLGWLCIIEAFKHFKKELPVNIKFCFEGMEEAGGVGLDKLIEEIQESEDKFFSEIDFVCISDNYYLGPNKPCVTYGLRGIAYFDVNIKCADLDLHSGIYGGTVYEAMTDLVYIFSKLVDREGKILIPFVNDDVLEMTPEEEATYKDIDFSVDTFKESIGVNKVPHEEKAALLQHRWRYPTLSFHGIHGAYSEDGTMTVIPGNITGKFSMRLVPNQDAEKVAKQVEDYIYELHNSGPSGGPNGNKIDVVTVAAAPAWLSDINHPNYTAGINANKRVHNGVTPDMIREGGSIPVTVTLQQATESNVMLLSVGASDDQAHSKNEKMNRDNFINAIKLFGAYLDELGKIKTVNSCAPFTKFKAFGFKNKTCNH